MKHISKKLADIHDNCEETLKLVAILKNNPPIHSFSLKIKHLEKKYL